MSTPITWPKHCMKTHKQVWMHIVCSHLLRCAHRGSGLEFQTYPWQQRPFVGPWSSELCPRPWSPGPCFWSPGGGGINKLIYIYFYDVYNKRYIYYIHEMYIIKGSVRQWVDWTQELTPFIVTAVWTLEATASTRDAMRSQFRPSFFFRMEFSA